MNNFNSNSRCARPRTWKDAVSNADKSSPQLLMLFSTVNVCMHLPLTVMRGVGRRKRIMHLLDNSKTNKHRLVLLDSSSSSRTHKIRTGASYRRLCWSFPSFPAIIRISLHRDINPEICVIFGVGIHVCFSGARFHGQQPDIIIKQKTNSFDDARWCKTIVLIVYPTVSLFPYIPECCICKLCLLLRALPRTQTRCGYLDLRAASEPVSTHQTRGTMTLSNRLEPHQ